MEIHLNYKMLFTVFATFDKLVSNKFAKITNKMKKEDLSTDDNTSQWFNNDFDYVELLKNDNPSPKFDENGDYYYINNNFSPSNADIFLKQDLFYQTFTQFLAVFQTLTQNQNTSELVIIIKSKSDFVEKVIKDTFFQSNLLKDKLILKFLKELWICLKFIPITNADSLNLIAQELEERMSLYFCEIGKRNYDEEDFELHKAVFENNLRMIRKICAIETFSHIFCEINEIDPNGNTPLTLAIKLNHLDAITVLCDHEADVKSKSYDGGLSPQELALYLKNKKVLKILINAQKKQKISHWESHKDEILKAIKAIPDFSMDLRLNFDSNILSLFSSITPCDFYKIQKSGGNVRIDMNISSIYNLKGKSSLQFQEVGDKLNIIKIDHEKRTSYDFIDSLSYTFDDEKKVEELLNDGLTYNKIFAKNVKLIPATQKKKEEKILGYHCLKYCAKGVLYITKEKVSNKTLGMFNESGNYKNQYKIFSKYFNVGVLARKSIVIKKQPLLDIKNKNSSTDKINKYFKKTEKITQDQMPHLATEYSYDHDDSDYEIEYIEKLKKKKNVKINKKPLEMPIWLCDDFPIQLKHFLPLIHVLSFTSTEFSQLQSAICSQFLPFKSFPMKISFPLGLTFHALLSVTGFSLGKVTPSIFEVNYTNTSDSHMNSHGHTSKENGSILDEKYAKDFYESYYKEKNIIGNSKKFAEDSDQDESLSFDRAKEIFLTNTEDDMEYLKYSKMNSPMNMQSINGQTLCERVNTEQSNEILLKKPPMYPLKNKTAGEEPLISILDDDIPSEHVSLPFKANLIKIPITPRKKRVVALTKECYNNSDESQKTLKCSVHPKVMKNFRNFFKYESNVAKELQHTLNNTVDGQAVNKQSSKVVTSHNIRGNTTINNSNNHDKDNSQQSKFGKCVVF